MKNVLALCFVLSIITVGLVGCDKKKAEVKQETTTTTPEGTTTETHTDKIETDKAPM